MKAYVRGDGEYRSEDGLDLWSSTLLPYGDKEDQVRPTLRELRLDFLFLITSVRYTLTFSTVVPKWLIQLVIHVQMESLVIIIRNGFGSGKYMLQHVFVECSNTI
jgi:hypothetical protein